MNQPMTEGDQIVTLSPRRQRGRVQRKEDYYDPLEPLGDDWRPADRAELELAWTVQRWDMSDRAWLRLWRQHRDRRTERPQVPIILYRGAGREGRRGMSWTQSRTLAEDYAERSAGHVWRTTAAPQAVLAVLTHGEVVVDPARLGRIEDVTAGRLDRRRDDRREVDRAEQRKADRARQRRQERQQAQADALARATARVRRNSERRRRPDREQQARRRAERRQRISEALLATSEATLAQAQVTLVGIEADKARTATELEQVDSALAATLARQQVDTAPTEEQAEAAVRTLDEQTQATLARLAAQRQHHEAQLAAELEERKAQTRAAAALADQQREQQWEALRRAEAALAEAEQEAAP